MRRFAGAVAIVALASCGGAPGGASSSAAPTGSIALDRIAAMQALDQGSPERDAGPLRSLTVEGFRVGMTTAELVARCPELAEADGTPTAICELDERGREGSWVGLTRNDDRVCALSLTERARPGHVEAADLFEARLATMRKALGAEDLVTWPDGCAGRPACTANDDHFSVGWRWEGVVITLALELESQTIATTWLLEDCKPGSGATKDPS